MLKKTKGVPAQHRKNIENWNRVPDMTDRSPQEKVFRGRWTEGAAESTVAPFLFWDPLADCKQDLVILKTLSFPQDCFFNFSTRCPHFLTISQQSRIVRTLVAGRRVPLLTAANLFCKVTGTTVVPFHPALKLVQA